MQCEAFENRLQVLLDERQCPEEDVLLAEHAADCPHCRDVLDAQAGLFDTVRDWSVANLEIDLVDRVVARATAGSSHEAAPASRSWWRTAAGRWTAIAVAAALVMVAYKGIDHYGQSLANRFADGEGAKNGSQQQDRSDLHQQSHDLDSGTFDLSSVAIKRAAERLGSQVALSVHYLHRGQAAVTDVLRGHFPPKPASATPGERTSSLLYSAATALAMS